MTMPSGTVHLPPSIEGGGLPPGGTNLTATSGQDALPPPQDLGGGVGLRAGPVQMLYRATRIKRYTTLPHPPPPARGGGEEQARLEGPAQTLCISTPTKIRANTWQ